MRKFLKSISVIQERTHKDALGCKHTKRRVNPYNPLSYIVIVLILVIALFWIGVVGIKDNSYNPFKWQ
jgi:hypothetical protein